MLDRIEITPQVTGDTTPVPVSRPAAPQVAETDATATPTRTPVQSDQVDYLLPHGSLQSSFEYDQQMNKVVIVLRDGNTGNIVQQIPPEKIQNMLESTDDVIGKQCDFKVEAAEEGKMSLSNVNINTNSSGLTTVSGMVDGINTTNIVSELQQVAEEPVTSLQTEVTNLQTEVTAWEFSEHDPCRGRHCRHTIGDRRRNACLFGHQQQCQRQCVDQWQRGPRHV